MAQTTIPGLLPRAAADKRYIVTLGASSGTDDTAAINAVLTVVRVAGGGVVRGLPGQTYLISSALVVGSNTTLDMTGCTVTANGSFAGNLVTNYSQANYKAYAPGTAAQGATVITTNLKNLGAQVGDSVAISGAGAADGTNIPLYAVITAADSTTITIDRPLLSAISNRGIYARALDLTVKVVGGTWNRGAVGGAGIAGHGFLFRYIRNLTCDVDAYNATAGNYAISVAAVWDYTLGIGRVNNTSLDGIHIMGPAYNGFITRLSGVTGDDALSLTCGDYAGPLCDISGDIIGLRWNVINVAAQQSCVKIMGAPSNTIDGIVGGLILGTYNIKYGVWIGEDTNNAGTIGGKWGSINVGTVACTPAQGSTNSPLFLSAPNATSIRAHIRQDVTSTAAAMVTTGGTTTATIDRLALDFDVTGTMALYAGTSSNLTVNQLIVDGRHQQTSGSSSPVALSAGGYPDVRTPIKSKLTAARLVAYSGTATGALRQRNLIVPPATLLNPSASAWSAANRALFVRFDIQETTVLRWLNWVVANQSGNVQLTVVKLSGSGLQTPNLVANTGIIACPAAGNQRTDLGAFTATPGDYAASLWADNTAAQFRCAAASGIPGLRFAGQIDGLTTGVTASSGLISWGQLYWACSLEADV